MNSLSHLPRSKNRACEEAFSLVEVLVAISIIGVLLAMLLPALQGAREASRRSTCANNLRQIGIALQSYHAARGHFPAGRGDPIPHVFSAFAYLLPYLGEQNVKDQIQYQMPPTTFTVGAKVYDGADNLLAASIVIDALLCPSDSADGKIDGSRYGPTNYAANAGSGTRDRGSLKAADGVFFLGSSISIADISDGSTYTAAASERLLGSGSAEASDQLSDRDRQILELPPGTEPTESICSSASIGGVFVERGGKWILGNYGNTLYDHYHPPNAPSWDCMNIQQQKGMLSARSAHRAGVNVLYCDGSLRFEEDGMDLHVWRAVATRGSGEIVPSN
jgi:prepilin-type N-terminal cleavage/methylation domain-containing protein/prepilin-type processing-associated H-X9-DG protein